MEFTIALAQTDSIPGNLRENARIHTEFIGRAIDGGADLVVFPELSLTGYTTRDATSGLALTGGNLREVRDIIGMSDRISVLAGGVEESAEYGLYNAAFLFAGGEVRCVHRKIYPPTYGMFEEQRYFLRGERVSSFMWEGIGLGALICEDLWHLPLSYLLAQDGAHLIAALSASPTRLSGDAGTLRMAEINGEQHRSLARLLGLYVVFCNRVGYEDGVNFWGGSAVISPTGETLVQAGYFEPDLVFTRINLDEVRRARHLSRHFLDDDPHLTLRELRRISRDRKI